MVAILGHCDDVDVSDCNVQVCDVSGMKCEVSGTYRPNIEEQLQTKMTGQLPSTAGSDSGHRDDEEREPCRCNPLSK